MIIFAQMHHPRLKDHTFQDNLHIFTCLEKYYFKNLINVVLSNLAIGFTIKREVNS